ncbi:MAG: FAD-dependent oxidoreductase [Candidatus Delongbacteria bacterium]|nr:FAD-dependent oxidoreductase [Candidatus Delongbacteria bacterium]
MDNTPHSPAAAPQSVAVVGGGIAGLTAAWLLSQRDWQVTIYEAAPFAGGRLRSCGTDPACDVGSHLMVRAYQATRRLLELLSTSALFATPRPSSLEFRWPDHQARLRYGHWPGVTRYAAAFLQSDLFPFRERWQLLLLLRKLGKAAGDSVRAASLKQELLVSSSRQQEFWQLLAVSLFNTQLATVDPLLLARTLKRLFRQVEGAEPLVPLCTLSEGLISPLLEQLHQAGCTLNLRTPVMGLEWQQGRLTALDTSTGSVTHDRYILALPLERWCRLHQCETTPPQGDIATIYFRAKEPLARAQMTGFPGAPVHWIIQQDSGGTILNRYAAVISAFQGDRAALEKLWKNFTDSFFAGYNLVVERWIIRRRSLPRQDSAFFEWRERLQTSGSNWDTIGDWVHPDLPATVEAAVDTAFKLADKMAALPTTAYR